MMFLHAETRIGEPEVRITDKYGVVVLRFQGTSTRNAIKVGLKFCEDALGEIGKPKEPSDEAPEARS